MLRLLLLILLMLPALAEDPPNPQVAVLDPTTGKALGHWRLLGPEQPAGA